MSFGYNHYEQLQSLGQARAYGVEVSVQKKLVRGVYGLASAAFTRSEYRNVSDIWRPRLFDNQVVVSFEGGYKPNKNWECSVRWV